ncbi:MAG: EAL domain-containing protein [Gammaproteobacteria bacterium]|nr:EAL domain-containing protein [Gammaproteobacteria bacterium]
MSHTVLLVDDEPSLLATLQIIIQSQGFQVLTAASGEAALEILQASHIDDGIPIIISDQRMPGMNGVQLLEQIRQQWPQTIRILLTGDPDPQVVMDAINRGGIFKLLTKPCESAEVMRAVRDAAQHFQAVREHHLLTEELQQANQELKVLSSTLEERVESKTQELMEALYYDSLTGLPSRLLMTDRLELAIKAARRANEMVTVLFLGLEQFSLVNESMGHEAGNGLLRLLAERLQMYVWDGDSVARMYGDKFCLVINNSGTTEKVGELADKILNVVAEPFFINGQAISINGHIGISLFPNDGETPPELFSHAEAAMREVRGEHGSNNYRFYSEELNKLSTSRISLQAEMRRALQNEEFRVFYQPRVNVRLGRVVGAEALIRWQHPERGLVGPDEFLFILEETGLIEPVTEWLLRRVCEKLVSIQEKSEHPVHMAVNISPRQLKRDSFIDIVKGVVRDTGLDLSKSFLEFEITENILLHDMRQVQQLLSGIKDMGISLAIDDFGTGYCSLSYLTQLPIDYLKIDRSFVLKLTETQGAKAVVHAIISMAHSLFLHVIAEGVETHEQLEILQRLGCDEFQGWYFSKPICEKDMLALLSGKTHLVHYLAQVEPFRIDPVDLKDLDNASATRA